MEKRIPELSVTWALRDLKGKTLPSIAGKIPLEEMLREVWETAVDQLAALDAPLEVRVGVLPAGVDCTNQDPDRSAPVIVVNRSLVEDIINSRPEDLNDGFNTIYDLMCSFAGCLAYMDLVRAKRLFVQELQTPGQPDVPTGKLVGQFEGIVYVWAAGASSNTVTRLPHVVESARRGTQIAERALVTPKFTKLMQEQGRSPFLF